MISTTSSRPRPRPRRTSAAALAAVPLLVLGLAACSAGSSGSAVKSDSEIAGDAVAWDVAYATCMRGEGVDVPDPSPDGTKTAPNFADDLDTEAFERANETCEAEVQRDLGPRPVSAAEKSAEQEAAAEMQETNDCLRAKGFDVSDPSAGGTGVTRGLETVPDEALRACGVDGGGNGAVVER